MVLAWLILVIFAAAVCNGDAPAPADTTNVLNLAARSANAEVLITSPGSLEMIWGDSADIVVSVTGNGQLQLFLNQTLLKTEQISSSSSPHIISHKASSLGEGLHRVYVVYRVAGNERPLEASLQFNVAHAKDKTEYLRSACARNFAFALGINAPCDGVMQLGHELRLKGKNDEAIPLLLDIIQYSKVPIVFPFLELALIFDKKGQRDTAIRFRQVVERLHPGYIPCRHPKDAPPPTHPSVVTIDLTQVDKEDMVPAAHLMCLWSGMLITRHGGMSGGQSAWWPGNHYKLLKLIAQQFQNSLVVEIGTLHGAAAIALAGKGDNSVVSFNVVDDVGNNIRRCQISLEQFQEQIPGKTEFLLQDATDIDNLRLIEQASLVFIDTNHHGDIEDVVYQYLAAKGWEGIMVLDDIFLNDAMDGWWGSVSHAKYDVTDWGHTASGTGIIDFANRLKFVL